MESANLSISPGLYQNHAIVKLSRTQNLFLGLSFAYRIIYILLQIITHGLLVIFI